MTPARLEDIKSSVAAQYPFPNGNVIRELIHAIELDREEIQKLKNYETTIGPDWKKDQLYKKAQSLKENLVLQHAFEAASIIMDLQHRIAYLTRKLQEERKAG